MKQLILRVPDDLHRRLTARAAREGRSVNALANEVLDAAADVEPMDRMARLRAKAAELGWLVTIDAPPVSEEDRRRAIESTRGIGPIVDRLIDEDRGRI